MPHYLVTRKIIIGEYEKSNESLVQADSEDEAREKALLGECHDDTALIEDWGIYDCGGEFHYSISDCKLVSPEHVEVLKQYFWVVN